MTSFYVQSATLNGFAEVIMEQGASPEALLEKAKIPLDVLSNPEILISHAALATLMEESVSATGCDHLGLLLSEKASPENFGLLGLLIQSSATFQEAIGELIKHLKIHSTGVTRELHQEGSIAYIACRFESPEMSKSTQAIQILVALTYKLFRNWSHPTAIYFSFSEPTDKTFYRRFFNAPVVFNAEFNGVVFHASDLKLPLPERNSHLHKEMEKQVKKLEKEICVDFAADVKRIIRKNLDVGVCSIDTLVQFFPFQKRTFQQKLKKLGTSYQDILDEVRFEKAEFHLQASDISATQLAEMLCYKNLSAFSIAFKNKYGVSPSAWRKRQRGI